MTFKAGFSALIFDGEVFPFLDIAEAVVPVREVLAMHAEVIRNQKYPGDEDHPHQSDGYPQWAQYMPLHVHLSRGSLQNAKGL